VIRSGVPLIAAGVVCAVGGGAFLPSIIVWLTAAMLVWGGLTMLVREHRETFASARHGWHFQEFTPQRAKFNPGQAPDRPHPPFPVILTLLPNEIEAEELCGLLRANGIKCMQQPDSMRSSTVTALMRRGPCEVLVSPDDLDAAQRVLHSLTD
jgi:hypothetical protein